LLHDHVSIILVPMLIELSNPTSYVEVRVPPHSIHIMTLGK